MGYHRLLTHRSYKVPQGVEYFSGGLRHAGARGRSLVLGNHSSHPSSILRPQRRPSHAPGREVVVAYCLDAGRARHQVQSGGVPALFSGFAEGSVFSLALENNAVPLLVLSALLLILGGLPFFLWAVCFRITANLHATWMVNSLTHFWGSRRFETHDDSRNNGFVALLSFGEGWHNNHHAHPTSARHGLAWYELDMSWLMIRFLQAIRVADRVRVAELPELTQAVKR